MILEFCFRRAFDGWTFLPLRKTFQLEVEVVHAINVAKKVFEQRGVA
jgi:hypothetical protein